MSGHPLTSGSYRRSLKRRARTLTTAMALFACLARPSSADPADSLVGTFALVESGAADEVITIERRQHKYVLYRARSGQKNKDVEVRPMSKPELEAIIKQPVNVAFAALGDERLAVIKVPKGWKIGSFVCNTGYWLATVLGPAELRKTSN